MPALTRGAATAVIQQLIDDTAGKLWVAANLQILLSNAVDELWNELLDAFPYLRSTEIPSVSLTAPGYADMDAVATRFHRVQSVVRDGQTYREADPRDVVIAGTAADAIVAPNNTYVVYGQQVHLFPYSTVAPLPFIRYSSRPTAVADLADDAQTITWPDGYQNAYIYEAAARAMEKGDREASERFQSRADKAMFRLQSYLRKRSTGPIMPYSSDDSVTWGGV